MKKTIILLAFACLFLLVACSANDNDIQNDNIDVDAISISIVENTLTRSSVSTVANAPVGYELSRWFDFWIEKQTSDGWYSLPMLNEDVLSNDIGAWSSLSVTLENIESNFGILQNGHYRIVVPMTVVYPYNVEISPYYEFTITDDTPER